MQLNLLQIHTPGSINVEQIWEMFIKKSQEDCFYHLYFLVKHKKDLHNFTLSFDLFYWE